MLVFGTVGHFVEITRQFEVRRARARDLHAVSRLNAALQDYERSIRPQRCKGKDLPPEYVKSMFRAQRRGDGCIFVACIPLGRVVGFLGCLLEEDVLESTPRALRITDLFVDARYRSVGIAKALIEEAQRFGSERSARGIQVNTLAGNKLARLAYRALGFTEYAVTYERSISHPSHQ